MCCLINQLLSAVHTNVLSHPVSCSLQMWCGCQWTVLRAVGVAALRRDSVFTGFTGSCRGCSVITRGERRLCVAQRHFSRVDAHKGPVQDKWRWPHGGVLPSQQFPWKRPSLEKVSIKWRMNGQSQKSPCFWLTGPVCVRACAPVHGCALSSTIHLAAAHLSLVHSPSATSSPAPPHFSSDFILYVLEVNHKQPFILLLSSSPSFFFCLPFPGLLGDRIVTFSHSVSLRDNQCSGS